MPELVLPFQGDKPTIKSLPVRHQHVPARDVPARGLDVTPCHQLVFLLAYLSIKLASAHTSLLSGREAALGAVCMGAVSLVNAASSGQAPPSCKRL
jgi:hypothetical protein